MTILVTGAHGFTGRYVRKALEARGHRVVALSSDLTDRDGIMSELKRCSPRCVIHLAAISYVAHHDPGAIYNVNIVGTRNLLEAIHASGAGPDRVILAGSASVYGNTSRKVLKEDAPVNPPNDYAVSKYAMELVASLWAQHLPITITRPFNYTGLGQDERFLIPKIVSHFVSRAPVIELGNLDVWREFNDVRFVADAYMELVESDVTLAGRTVNICTGQAYSLREVVSQCEKITGHKIDIQINPEFVRPNEVRVLKGDDSLLRTMTSGLRGYSLQETLSWMLSG